jgi:hypothetical protein
MTKIQQKRERRTRNADTRTRKLRRAGYSTQAFRAARLLEARSPFANGTVTRQPQSRGALLRVWLPEKITRGLCLEVREYRSLTSRACTAIRCTISAGSPCLGLSFGAPFSNTGLCSSTAQFRAAKCSLLNLLQ